MLHSIRRGISIALLVAALLLFVAFHFLPGFETEEVGWSVWRDLWKVMLEPQQLNDPQSAVLIASFLTFSLLIVASPFLTEVWTKSRLAWGFALTFCGLASAGFWVMIFSDSPSDPEPGGWCLMIAPLLNFAGLLLARGETPESGIKSFP